jgi:hypothetical protein
MKPIIINGFYNPFPGTHLGTQSEGPDPDSVCLERKEGERKSP